MSNNVKLDEILNSYKVGELKELAKVSGVTGYSKLKKAELIDAVSVQLQSVDTTAIDLPEELKDVLCLAEPAATVEKAPDTPKHSRPKTSIVGVAPHVMNVMQNGSQPPVPAVSRTVGNRKIYPNEPCPCGSGKKYKKCCGRL